MEVIGLYSGGDTLLGSMSHSHHIRGSAGHHGKVDSGVYSLSFDCGHVKLGCRVGLGETSNCLLLVLSKQKARFDYELRSFTANT